MCEDRTSDVLTLTKGKYLATTQTLTKGKVLTSVREPKSNY
jgi:hypothetical protein